MPLCGLICGTNLEECEDLIDALEECHRTNFLEKAFGKCNIVKQDLTNCLHESRLAAEREKIKEKRKKAKEFEMKKKKLEEEEYGKNAYLKKVIEIEYEKRTKAGH
ncbi:hypothetical protein KL905_002625 [Ogataea polymorpha]|uniref:COX assembly mitochondrial protein n=1 Tax=Ogataea polymorpha TaxID=460523 RepID=A0A1B7SPA3_9ASCO|nr:uncharacterized protein OGAPODRAFT_10885 [Ogataea polymorpha]KAG7880651.1 hypothetical protein KL937_002213 [Ogataea polymorpha]KAG7894518.1 hypothetical protein KL908_001890 [Ogataea polymorpha]KAG7899890.1 hypothetical protein KL935_003431 [Ogataea polymorpha]KAG7906729.1 hypothetical protein KL907_002369 [Ogataea polymorpha]KAG7909976.1 hypothetical protein KL906_001881 [Ogataea polymorpha]